MDTALLTGMSGVLGSLVGGSATVATAWITQKTANRRDLIQTEVRKRETLYGEFIGECAKRPAQGVWRGLPRGAQSNARPDVAAGPYDAHQIPT